MDAEVRQIQKERLGLVPLNEIDRAACKRAINFDKLRLAPQRIQMSLNSRRVTASNRARQSAGGAVCGNVTERPLGERDECARRVIGRASTNVASSATRCSSLRSA